ncbi:hypothetical protein CFRA_03625 [Corynebacterium frankenforstense DSM 45800]|uniref:DJ-1/PfpI domain-containing protein n=1 Tax=Corynebacterium frankenforstense DSM 45800 TaxID=1437875 RepID=A0A1L7CRN0_9CORY|nr:DJ-1/PfpI family protein [Corynebacterium frankenforstense]APT88514.1 hypothetical protein CFRA_03625 [Corynebacterium frankenforstense DSM 45800]
MKHICIYIQDTMADWEHGYLLQGISLQNALPNPVCDVRFVADTPDPVTTVGGMTVVPDSIVEDVVPADLDALVLIGADTWLADDRRHVLDLAEEVLEHDGTVAAICGATLGLAGRGLLDTRRHTSNAPEFLTAVGSYRGEHLYEHAAAVANEHVVTASSAGPLLWAKLIIEQLGLYPQEAIDAWFDYYDTADPTHFSRLLSALEAA